MIFPTGKYGRVTEIRGWDNESGRSVANVNWLCGSTNVYRVGHKGKVDLKVVQPATNGYVYTQHLPVLGKQEGKYGLYCKVERCRLYWVHRGLGYILWLILLGSRKQCIRCK